MMMNSDGVKGSNFYIRVRVIRLSHANCLLKLQTSVVFDHRPLALAYGRAVNQCTW